jgi:Tannase-like family of unknown function (DUF6351)
MDNSRMSTVTGVLRLVFAFASILAAVIANNSLAQAPTQFAIKILSSPSYAVTGGDALVEVRIPASTPLSDVSIKLNFQDVTSLFRAADASSLRGVIGGLKLGSNVLTAGPRSTGQILAKISVFNYPSTGPVFSGPHQTPFVCETSFQGLGAPLDPDCSAPTRVDYFYRSTASNSFQPFNTSGPRPSDLATTTTNEGLTVPYIVRREMGTINRAVYMLAILHDPTGPLSDPFTRTSGYNGRLVYSFGGGCQAGYHQGRSVGGVAAATFNLEDTGSAFHDVFLAKGYAIAAGSLNVTGTSCADLISAETAEMIKEHFIEEFGPPRYTIGHGASGGSMQQHVIGNNYPGILDGIMPGRSFPDMMSFLNPLFDCELLVNAINTSSLTWTNAQKTAVSGFKDFGYCVSNGTRYPNLRAKNCNATSVPAALVYDPVTNPSGARCTYQDNMVNVFGIDPATGFARRPFDNVGIQYGLGALNAGVISFVQFIDLNARAGGHDIDGNLVANRTVGDPAALQLAYQTGRVNEFGAGLSSIPIIDLRSYVDTPYADGSVDVHNSYHSGVNRARLIAINGNANNQIIVTAQTLGTLSLDTGTLGSPLAVAAATMLDALDHWLANIAADTLPGTQAEKVARNKPSDAVDACYTLSLQKITDAAQCAQMFPYFKDPRLVAGASAIDDVFKCALKPVDPADYNPALNAAQLATVRSVFPTGVCDFTKPGIGKVPLANTWLSYPVPGTFFHMQ